LLLIGLVVVQQLHQLLNILLLVAVAQVVLVLVLVVVLEI
jgi:hypothetical protein